MGAVPYPGNFWSPYAGLSAQKIEQYSAQKFLFCQTDNKFFFCVKFIESWTSQTLLFELSIVWPKKNGEFLKKHATTTKTLIHLPFEQVTIQNSLDPVYTLFKTFSLKYLLGGKQTVIKILFVYFFRRKIIKQLKANKIPRGFLLT